MVNVSVLLFMFLVEEFTLGNFVTLQSAADCDVRCGIGIVVSVQCTYHLKFFCGSLMVMLVVLSLSW